MLARLGDRAILALILLGAAVLRLAAVVFLADQTNATHTDYMTMAMSILSTGHMRDSFGNVAFYSPGYPMFLIPFFRVFGVSPVVGMAVNAGLGVLSVYLALVLARHLFSKERWALAAAATVAVYPTLVLYAVTLAKENLMIPLLLVQTILVIRFPAARPKIWAGILLGLVFGLELLTGPAVIFTAALIAAAFFGISVPLRDCLRKPVLRNGAIASIAFALGCLAVVGPWLAYTERELGTPVLTTNGGFNLYLGNNPAATGRFVGIEETPIGPEWPSIRESLGEIRAMAYLKQAALAYIVDHPGRTAVMTLEKAAFFWWPPVPDENASSADRLFHYAWLASYCVVIPLALLSLVGSRRRERVHVLLYGTVALYCLCVILTHVTARYRLPLMPIMAILAVDGLRQIQDWHRRFRGRDPILRDSIVQHR